MARRRRRRCAAPTARSSDRGSGERRRAHRVGYPEGERERRTTFLAGDHVVSLAPHRVHEALAARGASASASGASSRIRSTTSESASPVPGFQSGRTRMNSPPPLARSSERYPFGWKSRSRRIRSRATREAVAMRDRAVGEFDPRVGQVEVGREHREPGGTHLGRLGAAGEVQHQVEVVDHQVEHDGDVGAPWAGREPVAGSRCTGARRGTAPPRGARDCSARCAPPAAAPVPGAPQRSARPPRPASPPAASPSAPARRGPSARRPTSAWAGVGTATVTASTSAEQHVQVGKRTGAELRRDLVGAARVGVVDAHQPHARQGGEMPGVVPAEGADADYADRKWARSCRHASLRRLRRTRGSAPPRGPRADRLRARSSACDRFRSELKKSR